MTVGQKHITWDKIMLLCSSIIIPFIALIVTVVIFGTRIDDKVSSIQARQEKQDLRNGEFQLQLNSIQSQVDTVKSRQMQFYYQQNAKLMQLQYTTGKK